MNLVEKYVTNITSLQYNSDYNCYKLIADTNCYGCEREQEELIVHADDYKSIVEKGYYMC